jgi:hypothetical protein
MMSRQFEVHMVEPVRLLMQTAMGLDVIVEEFSAGYGIADLVGAKFCARSREVRRRAQAHTPIDHHHWVEVLLALRRNERVSFDSLQRRITFSDATLRRTVLPEMTSLGLVERDKDGYICLLKNPPSPAREIVAVELKQKRWREAILQARRYTYFADRTYIAVWNGTVELVDRSLLYRFRLGLIGVERDRAQVLIQAPRRKPRQEKMNRYCAEFLYRNASDSGSEQRN